VPDLSGGFSGALQDAVMKQMTPTAVARTMKLKDVMLQGMAKRITAMIVVRPEGKEMKVN
jgi:hypothetical protein